MMQSCVWWGCRPGTFFPTLLAEWKLVYLLWKTGRHCLLKLNILTTADLATPSLEMQSHAHQKMNRDLHISTIHNNQEQETTQKSISRSSHRMGSNENGQSNHMQQHKWILHTTLHESSQTHTVHTVWPSSVKFQQRQNSWGDQDGGYPGWRPWE